MSRPIVIVGGFSSPPFVLWSLRRAALTVSNEVYICAPRWGVDCSERCYQSLRNFLVDRVGRPSLIVAHSRGGQFAVVLAHRDPEMVSGVLTLGCPFRARFDSLDVGLERRIRVVSRLGDMNVPGVVSGTCFDGSCCSGFWSDLERPWPMNVPLHCVAAGSDRRVVSHTPPQGAFVSVVDGGHLSLLNGRRVRPFISSISMCIV